jgi:sugar/nucleoside kinase (ribokinase family)
MAETDAVRPGGAAGNVALAWQALGVPHQIAANIGDDLFGVYLSEAFPGASGRWPTAPTATTLSVGITHPDGERTFFTTRGHLGALTLPQVTEMLDASALRGGLLLVCGSFLTPALAADYDTLFDWAARHAINIALDTGWPPEGWTEEIVAETRRWLSHCRHVLLNEAEVMALTGRGNGLEAAEALADLLPEGGTIVVKRGPAGAAAVTADGLSAEVPAKRVRVIDTIGAGDVFNAGYLLGIASGKSLQEALQLGVDMAAVAISTEPRLYIPTVAQAEESA